MIQFSGTAKETSDGKCDGGNILGHWQVPPSLCSSIHPLDAQFLQPHSRPKAFGSNTASDTASVFPRPLC